jgi:hypothetical protein
MRRQSAIHIALYAASCVGIVAVAPGGCVPTERADPRLTRIQDLEDELQSVSRSLSACQDQSAIQSETIQNLRGLEGPRRLERLIHVGRIEIERLSGGYDEDGDGADDGVVVYLRLFDVDSDTIKSAGDVHVRIFDPAAEDDARLVAETRVDPDQLRECWYGRLMSAHYTIRAPWKRGSAPSHRTLTAWVRFGELLTGQAFEAQREVEIQGVAVADGG